MALLFCEKRYDCACKNCVVTSPDWLVSSLAKWSSEPQKPDYHALRFGQCPSNPEPEVHTSRRIMAQIVRK